MQPKDSKVTANATVYTIAFARKIDDGTTAILLHKVWHWGVRTSCFLWGAEELTFC